MDLDVFHRTIKTLLARRRREFLRNTYLELVQDTPAEGDALRAKHGSKPTRTRKVLYLEGRALSDFLQRGSTWGECDSLQLVRQKSHSLPTTKVPSREEPVSEEDLILYAQTYVPAMPIL